jgi:hypothetical protein
MFAELMETLKGKVFYEVEAIAQCNGTAGGDSRICV